MMTSIEPGSQQGDGRANTVDGKADRRAEEKDIRAWLLPLIAERQPEGKPEHHLRDFLRTMVDHAGILDERPKTPGRGRTYEFVHLSFQEYLCAARLAGEPPQQVVGELLDTGYVSQSWWREAILLMPGHLSAVENRSGAFKLIWELGDGARGNAPALDAAELAAGGYLELGVKDESTRAFLAKSLERLLTDPDLKTTNQARAAAGISLGRLGDPRLGVGVIERNGLRLPDIAWGETVPAGRYAIGGDKESFSGFERRQVNILHLFQLARYPVTYAQFDCFLSAPDFADERWWAGMLPAYGTRFGLDELSEPAFPYANHPRESVSWYQAVAFGRWLSDKLGETVELPHEYEWEVAARFPDGRFYPWGSEFDSTFANMAEGGIGQTSVVGIFPRGANPALGLFDLSGNVWEWCRNKYEQPEDDTIDASAARRVLRGGSWDFNRYYARAAYRYYALPNDRYYYVGCRLVRRPSSQAL